MKLLPGMAVFLMTAAACSGNGDQKMRKFIVDQFELNRSQTAKLIEKIEKSRQADKALGWIPPTKRVCAGWQLLHIAASEDNLANNLLEKKDLVSSELYELSRAKDKLELCRSGLPPLARIKTYLADSRKNLLETIARLDFQKLDEKPTPEAFGTRYELLNIFIWHEGHHQGQAHFTFNMYSAEFHIEAPKEE